MTTTTTSLIHLGTTDGISWYSLGETTLAYLSGSWQYRLTTDGEWETTETEDE